MEKRLPQSGHAWRRAGSAGGRRGLGRAGSRSSCCEVRWCTSPLCGVRLKRWYACAGAVLPPWPPPCCGRGGGGGDACVCECECPCGCPCEGACAGACGCECECECECWCACWCECECECECECACACGGYCGAARSGARDAGTGSCACVRSAGGARAGVRAYVSARVRAGGLLEDVAQDLVEGREAARRVTVVARHVCRCGGGARARGGGVARSRRGCWRPWVRATHL